MFKKLIMVLCVSICFCLCSCGNKVPSEKQIKEDIASSYSDALFGYQLTKITIERSQTEAKTYDADIIYTGTDDYSECEGKAHVKYSLYDGSKWMIDDFILGGLECHVTRCPSSDEIIRGFDTVPSIAECLLKKSGVGKNGTISDVEVLESHQNLLKTGIDFTVSWVYHCNDVTLSLITDVAYSYSVWGWEQSIGSTDFQGLGDFQFTGMTDFSSNYLITTPITIQHADLYEVLLTCNGMNYQFNTVDYLATHPEKGTPPYGEWYANWTKYELSGNGFLYYRLFDSSTGTGLPFKSWGSQYYGTSLCIGMEDYRITSILIQDEQHAIHEYLLNESIRKVR